VVGSLLLITFTGFMQHADSQNLSGYQDPASEEKISQESPVEPNPEPTPEPAPEPPAPEPPQDPPV
jgi:hypothetical protein